MEAVPPPPSFPFLSLDVRAGGRTGSPVTDPREGLTDRGEGGRSSRVGPPRRAGEGAGGW